MSYTEDITTMREGSAIAQRLLKSRTEPDDNEVAAIARALHATDRVQAHLKARAEEKQDRKALADALRADLDQPAAPGSTGHLKFAGLAGRMAETGRKSLALGTKALVPSGAIVGSISPVSDPVPLGKPLASLLAAIPAVAITDGPSFSYLRQSQRENNAAPVVPGAEKPVSQYGLTEVRDELSVVAHVSEEIPRFWLEDDAKLQQFLDSELRYGLAVALEDQIVNGDGLGANLTGFNATSGIVSQAFNADPIRTARSAISALMALGATNENGSPFFVFGLSDWEQIETASLDSGEYVLSRQGAPVNAAERRLWGVPVVLAPSIDAGTGWLVDPSAVTLVSDGEVRVEYNSATGFSRNTIIARCETRAALAVKRPAGIAKLDLTAA